MDYACVELVVDSEFTGCNDLIQLQNGCLCDFKILCEQKLILITSLRTSIEIMNLLLTFVHSTTKLTEKYSRFSYRHINIVTQLKTSTMFNTWFLLNLNALQKCA